MYFFDMLFSKYQLFFMFFFELGLFLMFYNILIICNTVI